MPLSLQQLQAAIDRADAAYYRPGCREIVTNEEYDSLKAQLRQLNPGDERLTRVGQPYDPAELRNKVKHEIPMGSLDNTDNGIAGFDAWYRSVCEKLGVAEADIVASLKVDGGSVDLRYEDGKLVRATTRGNGSVGENITANAVHFKNVPTTLSQPTTLNVRGEAILYRADFDAICDRDEVPAEDRSNPRNIGNGILGRGDGQDSDQIRFIAFNCYEDGEEMTMLEHDKLAWLNAMGFKAVPHSLCKSAQGVVKFYESVLAGREQLPFDIDGVVVKLADPRQRAAFITADVKSLLRPKFARAIKFPVKSNTTILEDCTITIGHTGAIIPTAQLRTVRVGGVDVSNALLNNWDEIERLGVQIGDTVEVALAGDIIPKVIKCVEEGQNRRPIQMPSECPCCGSPTARTVSADGSEGAVLVCTGQACPDTLRAKISHWIGTSKKGVGILGIGDAILETLWDQQLVRDPADLYTLSALQIQDLPIGSGGRLGASRAKAIVDEIQAKSHMSLPTFLGSIGIDLLGRRRVEQLQAASNGRLATLEDWLNDDLLASIEIPGFGPTIRTAVRRGIDANRLLITKLLQVGVTIDYPQAVKPVAGGPDFSGLTFCLTGTRAFTDEIIAAGGTIKSGVSKGLHFLVQKDPLSTSNKTQKAEAYGTMIISLDYLEQALNGQADLQADWQQHSQSRLAASE